MKILSLQGLLFAAIFYVVIDRGLNYTGTVVSPAGSSKFGGRDDIGITFGKNAIFIAAGALALVYITPRLF
jgi:hypothetical protein